MRFAKPASALLPTGFRWRCYGSFKKSREALTARTRTPSGLLRSHGGTLPRPGTSSRRVIVAVWRVQSVRVWSVVCDMSAC